MTEPSRENPPLTRREAREAARTGQIPIQAAAGAVDDPVDERAAARPDLGPVPVSAAATTPWNGTVLPGGAPAERPEAARPETARPETARPETVPFDTLRDVDADGGRPGAPGPVRGGAARPAEPSSLEDLFAPEHAAPVKKKRRGGGCLIALLIFVLIAGGLTAAGFWAWNTYGPVVAEKLGWDGPHDYEAGEATGEALITIEEGDGGEAISSTLFEAGVTLRADSFYDHLIEIGKVPTFYPGVYQLQQKMTSAAALEALQNPANKLENTVALQEGWTVRGTLEAASIGLDMPVEELEAAAADPSAFGVEGDSLEGWLFPAHYTFDPETTATQVIQAMVDRTRESLTAAGVPAGEEHRILTIASIIQREGGSADFGKVARVILNRLDPEISDTNQLLQMDSTAQFGYRMTHPDAPEQTTAFSTDEQLQDQNPWNTYVNPGLPAGPIANPGDEAIAAAMNPDDGDWQYFVTVDFETGETLFAATYGEQQQNEAKLHAWCDAHPGHAGCGG